MTAPAPLRATPPDLRAWQREALAGYLERSPRDFTAVATPGAGKTRFALAVAERLLAEREVQAICVVTPTDHLKSQWADAAWQVGIRLDPTFRNRAGSTARDYAGVVVTYAQVAAHPMLHRARTEGRRTLVVLDEVHHAGDAMSWGEAVQEAFAPATRRLALTGTPFRSDDNPIPFVTYASDPDGGLRSVADTSYGYAQALRDGVVRPVLFLAYSGEMRWRTSAGNELAARLGEPLTPDVTSAAWRTALDPAGQWIVQVLRAANERLSVKRQSVADAGGLVIAGDQATARAYGLLLRRITGEPPTVVLSDEPDSSRRIAEFRNGTSRWMVAVRMVSEGVDVPRLSVGVYATSASTPLFFAQAVGRFVRTRRRGETASVFLPSVPTLLRLAAELEAQRDHVLGGSRADDDGFDDAALAEANRSRDVPDADLGDGFQALEASASFDHVLFDGAQFGGVGGATSAAEADYLGLPGLLDADQVAVVLRQNQQRQLAEARRRPQAAEPQAEAAPSPHEELTALRGRLTRLVSGYAARTGRPHAAIHAELRRSCGGPPTAQASAEQLQARIASLGRLGG